MSAEDYLFQSTPLMRGETNERIEPVPDRRISIHSPHARGDRGAKYRRKTAVYFNPLPSCEGRPRQAPARHTARAISIHSPHARGDPIFRIHLHISAYFNPLPSCEGRPRSKAENGKEDKFQSTPLMRGETGSGSQKAVEYAQFQSTPLMRGETHYRFPDQFGHAISIHSPHARGDHITRAAERQGKQYFNPLPSCEGRPHVHGGPIASRGFQSTPLMRGETHMPPRYGHMLLISIHSPHARGDRLLVMH